MQNGIANYIDSYRKQHVILFLCVPKALASSAIGAGDAGEYSCIQCHRSWGCSYST